MLLSIVFFSLSLVFNSNKRKMAEKDLRIEREQKRLITHYDMLIEMASDMILLLDKMGFIKYANKIAQNNYGRNGKSILGMNFNSVISEQGKGEPLLFDDFLLSSSGERGIVFQSEHIFSNGQTVPVEIRVKRFYLYNETYYQFIIRDITEKIINENTIKESNLKLSRLNEDLIKANAQIKTKEQERVFHINLLLQNEKKLQEYTKKYRRIFDNMYSCIVIYSSTDGENFFFADLNERVEKVEHVKKEKIIGKNVVDVFPGIEPFGLLDIFKRVFKTGKAEFQKDTLYKDERISGWRENYVYKLTNNELVVIYDDITERVINLRNMQMISEYATLLINNSDIDDIFKLLTERIAILIPNSCIIISKCDLKTDGIFIYKIIGYDKTIIDENETLYSDLFKIKTKISDYSKEMLLNFTNSKLNKIENEFYEKENPNISLFLRKFVESPLLTKTNNIYTIGFVVNNKLYGNLTIFNREELNAYEINQIEILMNETSFALQKIYSNMEKDEQAKIVLKMIESIPVMLINFNKQVNVIMVNSEFTKSTGWLTDDFAKNNFISLCFPDEDYRKKVTEFMLSVKDEWKEFELCTKNGAFISTIWKNIALDDNSFLGVGMDISENKINEREKKQLEKQLFQVQKIEAIGQLAGGVAHNFNNMLAGMMGNAELIKENSSDSEIVSRAQKIIDAAEHSSKLTKQLLDFARKGQYYLSPIDIHKTINDVIEIVGNFIDKKIVIEKNFTANNTVFMGDSSQIQNVIMNLSLNARDAMPNGGKLSYITENVFLDKDYITSHTHKIEEGWYICLQVIDNGMGMTEEVKKHMFEPFFSTKDANKGIGLGLASIYGSIKNHKGSIEFYSEYSHGSVFKVYLPQINSVIENSIKNKEVSSSLKKMRILIVDDEDMIRDVLSLTLKRRGINVIQAKNGTEALEIYKNDKRGIDLILLDMIMPVMNGKETMSNLLLLNPYIKILLSSGFAPDDDVKKILENKNIAFIQKPFKTNEIIKKLNEMLN